MAFGKRTAVIEEDYYNFEQLVNDYFKTHHGFTPNDKNAPRGHQEYSFVATEECGNDSDHKFSIDGELDEWDIESIDKVIAEKNFVHTPSNYAMLNYLCSKGVIEAGDYLIRVCW